MHPTGKQFASGSHDHSVIIWSSETFEILRRIRFHEVVQSIAFSKSDTLYAGIFHNVMSCNALTGEVGLVLIPGTGYCESLSFRKTPFLFVLHQEQISLIRICTPQYLHPSLGLPLHMHRGPCLSSTKYTRLFLYCGRCGIKGD